MTSSMKVFQIKSVVPHLIDGFPVKSALPNLELQNKDVSAGKNNGIDPTSNTRNIEFQTEITLNPLKRFFKDLNFIFPGGGLSRGDGEDSRTRKLSKNMGITLCKKRGDRLRVKSIGTSRGGHKTETYS